MANQAFSEPEDLMLGAGELYFYRSDDNNKGFHHLGNAESFSLTVDVTTVEKNSSMNRHRELMASVTTAVKPTGTITLDEYNPYNVALGLFGSENVHHQAATALVNEPYKVNSVPGIISLKDSEGNRYYNVSSVVVKPASATPASALFSSSGTVNETDTAGGTFAISGTYTGSTSDNIYVRVVAAPTTPATDIGGLQIEYAVGAAGLVSPTTFTSSSSTTTDTITLGSTGLTLTVSLPTGGTGTPTFTPSSGSWTYTINCTPASTAYKEGVDYVVDTQSNRAGIIHICKDGAITADSTVLVDATVPKGDFVTVSGASASKIKGELLFVGDATQGNNYVLEGWNVEITPNGDFGGLISDGSDFGNFELTVTFIADYMKHRDYPYYKLTKTGVASEDNTSGVYDPLE